MQGVYDADTNCNANLLALMGCDDASCAADLQAHARHASMLCVGLAETECGRTEAPCGGARSECMLWWTLPNVLLDRIVRE